MFTILPQFSVWLQLPLWVCSSCRKAADQEMEKKPSIENFMVSSGFTFKHNLKYCYRMPLNKPLHTTKYRIGMKTNDLFIVIIYKLFVNYTLLLNFQDQNDSFLPDVSIKSGSEPTTPNGSICTCEACTERRYVPER